MNTVIRFFDELDEETVLVEHENVIIPYLDTTVFIDWQPYIVTDITYDYSDSINENGYILIDVILCKKEFE